ncbi:hypothetical protein C8Q80DRAFT_1269723 [Daedaleopsis nitida]|nr:hypothetical protein C8Q80DRAFT_1269723 [Daedaleopsis nitida]
MPMAGDSADKGVLLQTRKRKQRNETMGSPDAILSGIANPDMESAQPTVPKHKRLPPIRIMPEDVPGYAIPSANCVIPGTAPAMPGADRAMPDTDRAMPGVDFAMRGTDFAQPTAKKHPRLPPIGVNGYTTLHQHPQTILQAKPGRLLRDSIPQARENTGIARKPRLPPIALQTAMPDSASQEQHLQSKPRIPPIGLTSAANSQPTPSSSTAVLQAATRIDQPEPSSTSPADTRAAVWRGLATDCMITGVHRRVVMTGTLDAWEQAGRDARHLVRGFGRLNAQGWGEYNAWLIKEAQREEGL